MTTRYIIGDFGADGRQACYAADTLHGALEQHITMKFTGGLARVRYVPMDVEKDGTLRLRFVDKRTSRVVDGYAFREER